MESVLTIGLNPAFERVYIFPSLKEGEVNRAEEKYIFASGKGINTSRALNILGRRNTNITHLGGKEREKFLSLALKENIAVKWVESGAEIRTCTTLINRAKGTSTELVEESEMVGEETSSLIYNLFLKEEKNHQAVIISGSKAPGYEENLIPKIVEECGKKGIKVVLDIRKNDLLSSLMYRPYLIKINLSEFAETFRLGVIEESEDNEEIKKKAFTLMKELYNNYGTMTLISRGKFSSLYYDGIEEGEIESEKIKAVNTIGCGDTLTAAVTHYLLMGKSLKDATKEGMHAASRAAESATFNFKL